MLPSTPLPGASRTGTLDRGDAPACFLVYFLRHVLGYVLGHVPGYFLGHVAPGYVLSSAYDAGGRATAAKARPGGRPGLGGVGVKVRVCGLYETRLASAGASRSFMLRSASTLVSQSMQASVTDTP